MANLSVVEYTSSGTWVCPAGVTGVMVKAWGGGAGGDGGTTDTDGAPTPAGGAAAIERNFYLTVVPGTTYNITIGEGGAGGTGTAGVVIDKGKAGGNTSFDSLAIAIGANQIAYGKNAVVTGIGSFLDIIGGDNVGISLYGVASDGVDAGAYEGGAGGFHGPLGSGAGAGANANSDGVGANGGNAIINTGSGGGAGGNGSTAGGNGGTGGSGKLIIAWIV